MTSRCPDCNKFVSLETGDPEVTSVDVSGNEVTVEVRLVRNCADCGGEMKEANVGGEATIPDDVFEEHAGEGHELTGEEGGADTIESGGGRYAKNMIGADITIELSCECGQLKDSTVVVHVEEAAGSFDELN
jgi:hypothetical protein